MILLMTNTKKNHEPRTSSDAKSGMGSSCFALGKLYFRVLVKIMALAACFLEAQIASTIRKLFDHRM
jgi:hypothetical protein